MKRKKLVKQALKQPDLFSEGELTYFKRWLILKKKAKTAKISKRQEGTN
tara:strand:- start:1503 stop:1649 length:147 start_codon:yes stop_codon:yes gene_type:complete